MNEVNKLLESGILELYVLGEVSPEEAAYVAEMSLQYPEIKKELEDIEDALERFATAHAVQPDVTIKPFLMAQINYMERMGKGEAPSFPPPVKQGSVVGDYVPWLEREDLQPLDDQEPVTARIIGYSPEATIAIVWLKYGAPAEVHTDEHESFLIVEGSCNIMVDGVDNHLYPGDFFTIPLHSTHLVQVTSTCMCKLILQRAAA